MKKFTLIILWFLFAINGFSQEQTITLTFTGKDATTQTYVPLEGVYIKNTTLECDTIIYGDIPSITLTVPLGIDETNLKKDGSFSILSCIPNPFNGFTVVKIELLKRESLYLNVVV